MLKQRLIQTGSGYSLPYPADTWEEGTILGSGSCGAILMGNGEYEQIIFSREDLFAPMDESVKPIEMGKELPYIRGLLLQKKYTAASEYIMEMFRKQEHRENKIWTNPFFPAGDLLIHTHTKGAGVCYDYSRNLDFTTGISNIQFKLDGVSYKREAFFSMTDQILAMQLTCEQEADYSLRFMQHPYKKDGVQELKSFFKLKDGKPFLNPSVEAEEDRIYYQCAYRGRKNGYGMVCLVCEGKEDVEFHDHSLHIMGQKKVNLLVSVFLAADWGEVELWQEEEKKLREIRKKFSYEELKKRQKMAFIPEFSKTVLKLGEEGQHLETIFSSGVYEILSSCGKMPPNLQGVWTGTYEAGWSGDYTQNGNLQTAILGLLPTGHFSAMQGYFDYQESRLSEYRENSRILYNCRGIHIPSRTSDSGMDFHFDITWPMLFWTAGAGWAAHFYFDYWLYTQDHVFMKNRALPFMKEAALFYEDFLITGDDGRYLFVPSYSPENTPSNTDNAASVNATMDIAVAKELLVNLLTVCKTLKIEEKKIPLWERMLKKMPQYLINKDGALKEWAWEDLEDCYDHRHSSHLYMLYYDIPWYETEEIQKACKRAYELKMKYKKTERGTMSFGLVQAGMVAAHLGDKVMTEAMIQSMAENNYFRTYASSHDYGPSIFNADISGGMPALMLECIAQSSPVINSVYCIIGYQVRLLPALPACMQEGHVRGMYLRGGMTLNMCWKEGKVTTYQITNPLNHKLELHK